ncbi:MAG TPA: NAD(P)/FAD-dependent oxidoreductase, partial [Treponemataceae bacterium]|nr:NAD(P)/FAD-dependent oxidoreductase [Treponemataceae bacterium]
MKSVDLVVIGAGPAGLMCAWKAASLSRSRVLVLEKNSKPGKKLLVAGSGRCNLTNSAPLETFFRSYGDRGRFVRPCLQNFPPSDLREIFESRGLPLEELNDGKMFPRSGKSSDVLRVLLSACSA